MTPEQNMRARAAGEMAVFIRERIGCTCCDAAILEGMARALGQAVAERRHGGDRLLLEVALLKAITDGVKLEAAVQRLFPPETEHSVQ